MATDLGFVDNKAVSLHYLSVGAESRRIFGSQEPTVKIDQITTKKLLDILDNLLTTQRNIAFDRYTFVTRNQLKATPVETFYWCLRELSFNCDLGSHEESIKRDVFITKMQDGDIQRELLNEIQNPKRAVDFVIKIKKRIQNQIKISGISAYTMTCSNSNPSVNNIRKAWNTPRPHPSSYKPTICPNSGKMWSPRH